MTPFEEIERDLDWREKELALLRVRLADRGGHETEKRVLFRAAWALLYAHYEGFTKFALTVYFEELGKSGQPCAQLPLLTQCFALRPELRRMKKKPDLEFLESILDFEGAHLTSPATFPSVETQSNLWPAVLEELLAYADIELPSLQMHSWKLKTLVSRRNKIAHGERHIIQDLPYYIQFEDAFKIVSYELAYEIDRKFASMPHPPVMRRLV